MGFGMHDGGREVSAETVRWEREFRTNRHAQSHRTRKVKYVTSRILQTTRGHLSSLQRSTDDGDGRTGSGGNEIETNFGMSREMSLVYFQCHIVGEMNNVARSGCGRFGKLEVLQRF